MNIIIIGAGKVGFNLAKKLSIAHNVTVIDINSEALHRIQEEIDILVLNGDAEDINTYREIKTIDIDLFIAVTNIDNTNLVSSLVAESILHINKKIIRLKKEYFDYEEIKIKFNIDKFIFPVELASKAIDSLLTYPKANNVKFFKHTNYELISIMIPNSFKSIKFIQSHYRLIGIERDKKFHIVSSHSVLIEPNDLLYLFALEDNIVELYKILGIDSKLDIRNCVVVGGSSLGIAIAKRLSNAKCSVKLLEKDVKLCEEANTKLKGKVNIINTKYNSHDIFKSEALYNADMFVSTTVDDEFNIIKSLEAKENGIKKIVAINNDLEYYGLMHSLGITVIRGPKISAYNKIMEEINSSKIVIQKNFCGSKAILLIRKIFSGSLLIGMKINPIVYKGMILFYIRDERLNLFDSNITLQKGDLIVSFAVNVDSHRVKKWLYEL